MTGYAYRCFDVDGNLLYIGSAVDVAARMKQHSYNSAWYPLFDSYLSTKFESLGDAIRDEEEGIRDEAPIFNRMHNKCFDKTNALICAEKKNILCKIRLKCLRCKYEWTPRSENLPAICPRCKSRHWQTEKKRRWEK